MYLKYRIEACHSPIIAEKDLYNIMKNVMKVIIPQKNRLVSDLLELYNQNKSDEYDEELQQLQHDIQVIETKKSLALDLIFNGELKKDELKHQFKNYEKSLQKIRKREKEILKQNEILKKNNDNMNIIIKNIQEEINSGCLEEFIREFVDEIIVSKIDENRYNLKLDIYLNLIGEENNKTKGSRHIKSISEVATIFLKNCVCSTIEKKRKRDKSNNFIYNVYI